MTQQERIKELEDEKESLKTKILIQVKLNNMEQYEDDSGNMLTYRKQTRKI